MNGVTFGNKHSYSDYGLFLRSRPVIAPPKPKTHLIELPGSDGALDLSTAITGYPTFDMRTITMEFLVIDSRDRWASIYSQLLNELNGQVMRITFDDDPDWFYEGRVSINEWKSSKKTATITIECVADPYKLRQTVTSVSGTVSGETTIPIGSVGDMRVIATITAETEGTEEPFQHQQSVDNFSVTAQYFTGGTQLSSGKYAVVTKYPAEETLKITYDTSGEEISTITVSFNSEVQIGGQLKVNDETVTIGTLKTLNFDPDDHPDSVELKVYYRSDGKNETSKARHNDTVTLTNILLEINGVSYEPMTVAYNGRTYELRNGTNQLRLSNDDQNLVFDGEGSVTIEYRGGSL